MARILVEYRVDHRLELVQITTGQVNFLVQLKLADPMLQKDHIGLPIDHWEKPSGKTKLSMEDYKTLYRERLQHDW